MKPLEKRRGDWWSWQSLLRRERGWAAPQRNDMLALRWREAVQRREGRPMGHCRKTAGETKVET